MRDGDSQSAGEPSAVRSAEDPTGQSAHETQASVLRVRCPQCHSPMDVSQEDLSSDIACSQCGSRFNLIDDSGATYKAQTVRHVAHFELVEELGRGTFGSVWKARDTRLDRIVALKIPRKEQLSRREAEQFLREARAAAQLRHPNIVGVHEVGRDEDRIYLVTDLIRGVTLEDWLTARKFAPPEAAQLCATIADALHHAHEHGVIHRDIKPGNIMITAEGVPFITDFGLARREVGELTMTLDGNVMGTPSYMSPEQALGDAHHADRRSDIYSLGVILYRLLTGELPFRGNSRMVIMQIVSDEPPPPRRLCGHLSRDIENITLKCLEKNPANRYASAKDLADDLRRFVQGEPVQARQIGPLNRLWRWARRNPKVASLAASVFLLLLVTAIGSAWAAMRINEARGAAEKNAETAEQNARRARVAEFTAVAARDDLAESLGREQDALRKAALTVVDMYTLQGLTAANQGSAGDAVLWFAKAVTESTGDSSRRQANVLRTEAWLNQIVRPKASFFVEQSLVRKISFSPGGRFFLVHRAQGQLNLHDVLSNAEIPWSGQSQELVTDFAWHPRGDRLAVATRNARLRVVTLPAGETVFEQSLPAIPTAIAFQNDSALLAATGVQLFTMDLADKSIHPLPFAHPRPVFGLAVNPSGSRLATVAVDSQLRVFPLPPDEGSSDRPLFDPVPWQSPNIYKVPPTFLNDRQVLWVPNRNSLSILDVETGKPVRQFAVGEELHSVAVDPNRRLLAVCEGFGVNLIDLSRQTLTRTPIRHGNRLMDAAFSPDGSRLLTSGQDGVARLWTIPDGRPVGSEIPHQGEIFLAAYSADGQSFATSQNDGLVRIWSQPRAEQSETTIPIAVDEYLTLDPSGQYVMPATYNLGRRVKATRVHEIATGQPAGPPIALEGFLNAGVFSPDSRFVALLTSEPTDAVQQGWPEFQKLVAIKPGQFDVRDWRTGRQLFEAIKTLTEPIAAAFAPDGQRLVILCGGGQGLIVDPLTGRTLVTFRESGALTVSLNIPTRIVFHPDQKRFITLGIGEGAKLYDVTSGALLRTFPHSLLSSVEFSRDGKLLATSSRDNSVIVWDLLSDEPKPLQSLQHRDWVFRARFSSDDRLLVTACRDRMARIWDWRTGQMVAAMKLDDECFDVAFHPQQPYVLTAGRDGSLRLWALDGQPIAPPRTWPTRLHQVAVSADGKWAVAPSSTATVSVVDLTAWNQPSLADWSDEEILRLGETVSARRVVGVSVVNLSTEEWIANWNALPIAGQTGTVVVLSDDERLRRRHRSEATRLISARQYGSAIWHLDQFLQREPKDLTARYERGFAKFQMSQDDAAIDDFSAVLATDSKHQNARHFRAHALYRRQRIDLALADVDQLLLDQPDDGHFWSMHGLCLATLKRYRDAYESHATSFEKFSTLNSATARTSIHTVRNLLVALRDEKDWPTALRAAQTLRDLWQHVPEAERTANDYFNIACSWSLSAEVLRLAIDNGVADLSADQIKEFQELALPALSKSVVNDGGDAKRIAEDSDLNSLRDLPGYAELLQQIRDGKK